MDGRDREFVVACINVEKAARGLQSAVADLENANNGRIPKSRMAVVVFGAYLNDDGKTRGNGTAYRVLNDFDLSDVPRGTSSGSR